MRQAKVKTHHPTALLALLAVGIMVTGLLALVSAKPAWAASRTFEPALGSPFAVGSNPTTVTNADFDADGKMDLAAQNLGSNTVSVRLGNGDGTFQDKQDYAVGSGPTSVTSADLNDDGKTDLAVSNQFSNTVSVRLGQGDGTFQDVQNYGVGFDPTSVISADFNGDTHADLAVANFSSSSVSVLLGQDTNGDGKSDGTFKPKTDYLVYKETCNDFICVSNTAGPNQIIAADFNRDAKADLATANFGGCGFISCAPGGVSVLLGNGNGTFQNPTLPMSGTTISSIVANDSGDIVAAKYEHHVVSVLRSNGNGTFFTGPQLPVGTNPSAVASEDLDGDARADLAVSNFNSDNVSILFNDGSSGFQPAQNFPAGDGPAFVVGANLNADTFADLAVANQNSSNVSVLLNTTPAPETTITRGPPDPDNSAAATFEFTSSEPGSTFQCALDDPTAYSPCTSPTTVPDEGVLADGSHTFYVKATGAGNKTDPTAATRTWRVDATAPTVDPVSPANGATGVALATNVEATFSEAMNSTTLDSSTFTLKKQNSSTTVAATVTYDSNSRKATLDPGSNLEANTSYTATVKGGSIGVKDTAGNALGQDYSWTFTTAPSSDNTAPRVTGATPTGTGVVRGTNVRATFSERMSPTSITKSTLKLFKCASTTSTTCTTQVTNVAVTLSADGLRATLNPYGTSSTLLATRTKYKAVVTTGARDVAGNALDQNTTTSGNQPKTWTFVTGSS